MSQIANPAVGRDEELATCDALLDALADGAPSCVSVEGEAGIGKTRLLSELAERAEQRGHLVLRGSAAEFERDLPFSVWADALDAYVASQPLAGREGWSDELAVELAGVLPSLGERRGGAVADERYRVHRAVLALLDLLSEDQALVLELDDLHWADDASTELIVAVLRRWTSAPVLLALGFRPGQAPARLMAALSSPVVTRLALHPLSKADAAALLGEADEATAAAAFEHSGGNPFYLEQLARSLPARGVEGAADGFAAGLVPEAVAASLAGELATLDPRARDLLDAAAVAGEPFEPDIAAAITEQPFADALSALDQLLAIDLIRTTSEPRRFVFRHPLVRRAVYEATPAGWRLGAHQRAAQALWDRGAPASERAHHVERFAAPGDAEAIALLVEAGEETASRAPASAARWYAAALRLLPASDKQAQVDVRVALAGAQRSQGNLEAGRVTLLEAAELSADGPPARRVELTALCAAVEHWLGLHEEAHARIVRACEELGDQRSPEAAAVQIELAVDGMYQLDFEQTITAGERALALAREHDDPALVATACSVLALGESASGRVEDARSHRDEAARLIDAMADEQLGRRLEALYYLGWAENYLAHYDAAIAHARRGIDIARATGGGRLLLPLLVVQGYPLELQGRIPEAIEVMGNAVDVARTSGISHYLYWALFEQAWARYFAGDLAGAISVAEESLRVGGPLTLGTMPSAGGGPGWVLAACRLETGDADAMLDAMRDLGDEELNWAIPVEKCFNWESLALAELARGDMERAESYAVRAERESAEMDLDVPRACALRARAAVLLARGDAVAAAQAAERSFSHADAAGAHLQAAFSRALQGRALAAAGDRKAAIDVLREAERTLDGCGSLRERDSARRELRKLGARAEPRGPATVGESGVSALTKRELEIAALVTDRLTNREIAAQLFLSEKTIESHLRNLFMKLGASSRTEVARTIERERSAEADAA